MLHVTIILNKKFNKLDYDNHSNVMIIFSLPTNLHFLRSSKWVQKISPLSLGINLTNSGCVSSQSCFPEILKLFGFTPTNLNSFIAQSIQCLTCISFHWTGSGLKKRENTCTCESKYRNAGTIYLSIPTHLSLAISNSCTET